MLASSLEGRAMEVNAEGKLLWQYFNILDDGFVGILPEAQVLPLSMDRKFFENLRAACEI